MRIRLTEMGAKNNRVFVDRERELAQILDLISTGDALIIGLPGVGKTALIEKVTETISLDQPETNAIVIVKASQGTYPGWLSERLAFKCYEQAQINKKHWEKIKSWFSRNGPDLLKTVKDIVETSSKALGNPIDFPTIALPERSDNSLKADVAVLTLINQFTQQTGKTLLIIIENVHLLCEVDKKFLTDLLSNHSNEVHLLLSRRPEEKRLLFSSPEVNDLIKENRIVNLIGLDESASELLIKAYNIPYEQEALKQLTDQLSGNAYFLNLFFSSAQKNMLTLSKTTLASLLNKNSVNIRNYLQSQYINGFSEFKRILDACSVLPSNIHAEIICEMIDNIDTIAIQEKLLELENRGLLQRDETFGGYRLFHPLLALYIYSQLGTNDRLRLHQRAALYYQNKAKQSASPLNMIATLYNAEKSNDRNLQFWTLYNFALIYYRVRRLRESQEYIGRALQIAKEMNSIDYEFQALILTFEVFQGAKIVKIDEKLDRLKYIAKIRKNRKKDLMHVAYAETNYYMDLGITSKAIQCIKKCRVFAKQIGDTQNYYYYSHILAMLFNELHRFSEARTLLTTCLRGFEQLNDLNGQMVVLQELGNVEVSSDPDKAIEYNNRAIELAKNNYDDLVIGNALHGIGVALFEQKKLPAAKNCFIKSLAITKKVGDTKGLVTTYIELASLMVEMKKPSKAFLYLNKAATISKNTNYRAPIPRIAFTYGELLELKKEITKAKEMYIAASDLYAEVGDEVKSAYAYKHAWDLGGLDDLPLEQWRYNVANGKYKTQIGSDGLTDLERKLEPFVDKKVKVVVNQGKWPGVNQEGMKLVFAGILRKDKYDKRISELDEMMGHGKYDWWIEGKPIDGVNDDQFGNWIIAPIFVESIIEIKNN